VGELKPYGMKAVFDGSTVGNTGSKSIQTGSNPQFDADQGRGLLAKATKRIRSYPIINIRESTYVERC
jgi:hypothetical protein